MNCGHATERHVSPSRFHAAVASVELRGPSMGASIASPSGLGQCRRAPLASSTMQKSVAAGTSSAVPHR